MIYSHAFAADEIAAAELWEQKIGAKIRQQTQWQHGRRTSCTNLLKVKEKKWRPQRDLNPRCRRERAVS